MTETTHQDHARQLLRLVYGAVPLVAGLDKFFNVLTQWDQYLNPLVLRMIPVSPGVFMGFVGIVEMAVGALILARWTKPAAYLASAWLVAIALNLLAAGKYLDVAVRDLVMAVGAYTLAQLTAAHEESDARDRRPVTGAEAVRPHTA